MPEDGPFIVTEASWRPGLPPPIEALQAHFPAERGYTIEYAIQLQRQSGGSGWIGTPIAIVTAADGDELTFVPGRVDER